MIETHNNTEDPTLPNQKGFISFDSRLVITSIDHAAAAVINAEAHDIQGQNIDNLLPDFNKDFRYAFINHVKSAAVDHDFSLLYQNSQSASIFNMSMSVSFVNHVNYDEGGVLLVSRTFVAKTDTTDEESSKSVTQDMSSFYSMVVHELKEPLRAMQIYAQVIREDYGKTLPQDASDHLFKIEGNGIRLQETLSDIRKLVSVSTSKMQKEDLDISKMSQKIFDILKDSQPNRTIELTIQPDLHIFGDKGMIQILLSNLIRNAWKYTSKQDHPTIEIGQMVFGSTPCFFVKDNGIGFEADHVGMLFKPFSRLHSSEGFKGSGLGLSIAKKVTTLHNGKIWADGALDKGATFYFSIGKTPA